MRPAMTPVERFFAPAELLFGKYWQKPLSRRCGYSQGHLQQVRAGTRTLTVGVQQAVLRAYLQEIKRSRERAARAMAGVIKIIDPEEIGVPAHGAAEN